MLRNRLLLRAVLRAAVLRARVLLLGRVVALPPAVPVADAIVLVAPPPARVLAARLLELDVAFAGERRVAGLLPVELEDVAAQPAVEVADHVLALALIHPDALDGAGADAAARVIGVDLHRAEVGAPQAERARRLHLRRRRGLLILRLGRGALILVGRRRAKCGSARGRDREYPSDVAELHRGEV